MLRMIMTLAAISMFAGSTMAAPAEKPVSVVLVHGAFVDGSGWKPVHDILVKDGYEVLVVQNPTITLAGDVDLTRQAIAEARHPVVLVGHSYGGAVITEAGTDEKVKRLVYVAAYAPDQGESVKSLKSFLPPEKLAGAATAPVLPPKDGFLTLDKSKMPSSFAADIDPSLARFMADSQVPWGLGAVGGTVTNPAWKTKPTTYLLTEKDRMIPPVLQLAMAERAKAEIVKVESSHAVMLSHPKAVAHLIEEEARKVATTDK